MSRISIAIKRLSIAEEHFVGSLESKACSGSVVDEVFDPVHVFVRDVTEISSLGIVLPNKAVGVFGYGQPGSAKYRSMSRWFSRRPQRATFFPR
jgi:hypothetical protein